jgi:CheY-like chemotaxis protein
VVDDNRDTANSCALLLKALGHEVDTAFDGVTAVERAREFNPQVLFLDIGLPKMNGYDVAKTLRNEGFDQMMIAVSGYGQPEDRQRSREAGFDYHLVKPVDQAALTAVVEGVDDKHAVSSG